MKDNKFKYIFIIGVIVLFIGIGITLFNAKESSSSKDAAKRNQIIKQYASRNFNFADSLINYMIQSKDGTLVFIAGIVSIENGNIQKGIDILELGLKSKLISNEKTISVAVNKIVSGYTELKKGEELIEILTYSVEEFSNNPSLFNHYGVLVSTLFQFNRYEEGAKRVNDCIELYEKSEKTEMYPFGCYVQKGVLEMQDGNIKSALNYLLKGFNEDSFQYWYDENVKACPAIGIPLALDKIETNEKEKKIKDSIKISKDILKDIPSLSKYSNENVKCSDQKFTKSVLNNNNYFEDVNTNFTLHCFDDEKKASLYKIENAHMLGKNKFIYNKIDDQCYFYLSGMIFTNTLCHPLNIFNNSSALELSENELSSIFQKPLKKIKNGLHLHFLETNYFHFTIEVLSKIFISLQHPILNQVDDLRLIINPPNKVIAEFIEKTYLSDKITIYDPKYRYEIENLYSIEWEFNHLMEDDVKWFDDHFVPPASVVRMTRDKIFDYFPVDRTLPRNLLIFLHRGGYSRSLLYSDNIHEKLYSIANRHGLEFKLHGFSDLNVMEQIEMFHRAVVVIGVHGAGLTNIIYCQENTSIIEFPAIPYTPGEYARLSSIFNFPYYSVESAEFFFSGARSGFNDTILNDIEVTLDLILTDFANKQL